MIYITGDTHGEFGRFSKKRMKKKNLELTEHDYVIICGDMGLCWAEDETFRYDCDFFAKKPYATLWVQGNHENYDMIETYPLEEWHGGMVRHIVRDKVILLERGQIFEIEGQTFFTFGGASSHDIQGGVLDKNDEDYDSKLRKAIEKRLPFRINHESWWKEELPSEEEMEEGRKNLAEHNYKVDYVLTHCCATGIQEILDEGPGRLYRADILTDYLQEIEEKLDYKHWFFGHYHMDRDVDEKHSLLFHALIPLESHEPLENVPVPGHPRYCMDDMVKINIRGADKVGKICIVDAYGTFEQKEEPSYDILVEEERMLYKHICESEILGRYPDGI